MDRINVTRSSMPEFDEYVNEIADLWDSHWLTNMGVKHQQFQALLKSFLEVPNIELLTNGHMALELSIQALGFNRQKGDIVDGRNEVITTPFTFASTTHAIVRNGLKPTFCDINPYDYTIDVNQIEELINENTLAILPVHVYGNICDVSNIQRIADKHGLKVIYDAAHAFGEKYKGQGIGNFGDASCFSFHATKVFNSIEGGAVSFNDVEFGRAIYRLKNFGIKDEETVDGIGANAKMNEFCAAMGICNLRHIEQEIEKRRIITECYDDFLKGIRGISIREKQTDVESNYSYYPILIDGERFGETRDEVYNKLSKEGIFARKYFYPLTNTFACFNGKYDVSKTPIAWMTSERVLTLPLYADLRIEDVERICKIVLC